MLDAETKRRIDTCRDILVGKVPDPKSQVEQITIALIYKFMDDMDREAEELGSERTFFADEFAKYGWQQLMRPGVGGHEMLALYAEAIQTMNQNTGIPELFRDIFKNAYLPYRDPETLRAFLKEIDGFTYDHSERLGDAFEYLLSVLGSQGDAGQFRTPRHIIDFIVEVIAPQKNETVLDPACGTAGFLISAWKHILKANTDKKPGDKLTPDERRQLTAAIKGYDISPDMVRLSLVNLYLHGFTEPHIFEYDTLTQEERWNETADVILANPPFMSPKGGIKPHKRFSIQAKRSEVLFVDYMAEHLTPSGRAGIIVPEGIIFQSQTAHTALRKMLVESSLVAVISLPAGCFNPYSGVKTSILILDKALTKKAQTIAFFKVENDGYGLGAQRRPIDKNDLPQVQAELDEYLQALRNGQPIEELQLSCGLIVAKDKIAVNGDYNLSGERYREGNTRISSYPMIPIGDICELFNGRAFKPEDWENEDSGGVPIVRIQNLNNADSSYNYYTGEVSEKNAINNGELLFSWSGSRGTSFGAHIWKGGKAVLNQHIFKVGFDETRATKMYLLHALNKAVTEVEENLHGGVGLVHITKGNLEKIEIPLPPLEVQKEIAAEIEDYQKVINGARAVLDNYRPHIPIHPEWPMDELGNVCTKITDGSHFSPESSETGYPYVTVKDLEQGRIDLEGCKKIDEASYQELVRSGCKPKIGDVLFSKDGTVGKTALVDFDSDFVVLSSLAIVTPNRNLVLPEYVYFTLSSERFISLATNQKTGVAIRRIVLRTLKAIPIPIPSIEEQKKLIANIEAEQTLVNANRELIARFEQKIQDTLARVWGED